MSPKLGKCLEFEVCDLKRSALSSFLRLKALRRGVFRGVDLDLKFKKSSAGFCQLPNGKTLCCSGFPNVCRTAIFSRSLALRSWFLRLSSDISWWLFEAGAIGLVACAAGESSPHFSTYSGTAMQLVTLSTLLPSLNLTGVRQTSTVLWTVHHSIRSRRLWGRYCITCRCRSC